MRYAGNAIKKALINKLEVDNSIEYPSGSQISVYTEVPTSAKFPLIIIEPSTSYEDDNTKQSIDQAYITRVEVLNKHRRGFGGWEANDLITDQITSILRNKLDFLDLSSDSFKIKSQTIESIEPFRESYEDGNYFRTIIYLQIRLQEIN